MGERGKRRKKKLYPSQTQGKKEAPKAYLQLQGIEDYIQSSFS